MRTAMMSRAVLLALAGLLVAVTAAAAQPAAPKKAPAEVSDARKVLADYNKDPMQVVIVEARAEHCAPACPRWIAAQGTITEDTRAAFAKVIKQAGKDKLPVFINSRGGRVDTALEIGRLLRKAGLVVAIGITEFDVCAPTDPKCAKAKDFRGYRGQITSYAAYCASSCPFILAGGVRRYVPPAALVGVHEITNVQRPIQQKFLVFYRMEGGKKVEVSRELVSQKVFAPKLLTASEKDPAYRQLRKYLADMGVSDELVALATATKREDMHWLTDAERRETRLVTDVKSDEDMAFAPFPLEPAVAVATWDLSAGAMAGIGSSIPTLDPWSGTLQAAPKTSSPPPSDFATDGLPHTSLWEGMSATERGAEGTLTCEVVNEATGGTEIPAGKVQARIGVYGLALDLAMRRNADTSFSASHLFELRFTPSPDLDKRQVNMVTALRARTPTTPKGDRLTASIAKISTGFFWLALSSNPADRERNAALLRGHRQLDFGIEFDDGRSAVFTVDCGDAGRQLLVDSLTDATAASTAAR